MEAHYTLIGDSLPTTLRWLFIATAVIGLAMALMPAWRWSGLSVACAAGLTLVFHIANPYCSILLVASGSLGKLIQKTRVAQFDQKSLRRDTVGSAAGVFIFAAILLFTATGKDIKLSDDRLTSNVRFFPTNTTKRGELALVELTGWDGELVEWRFETTRHGASDPFVANMIDSELYWDHGSRILTGPQVAAELAKWADVKPKLTSYGSHVYKMNSGS